MLQQTNRFDGKRRKRGEPAEKPNAQGEAESFLLRPYARGEHAHGYAPEDIHRQRAPRKANASRARDKHSQTITRKRASGPAQRNQEQLVHPDGARRARKLVATVLAS